MRSSTEQHEFQSEELKASNEELQAMNEELRSAAEELETSKEELQSINEELRTVNQELKIKIDEATVAANNLQNLINSAEVATLFLDRSFRVVFFTPSARNIFNLIPSDYGRPVTDITNKLLDNNLVQYAEEVLEKLAVTEHEVDTKAGSYFTMRMLPYRTREDYINGVVVTFFDITDRKLAQKATEEDLRATKLLHDLSTRLVLEENFQVLYDEVMTTAIGLTHGDAGMVQILDDETQELMLLSASGFSKEMTDHFQRVDAKSHTSGGIALANNKRSFVDFDDSSVEEGDDFLQMHIAEGYLSGQSTPLIARLGKPLGMISTYWKDHHHRPSESELRYLDLLARQAADLIEQLLAQKELQQSMNELTRFNNAMVSRESRMIELKKEVNELCKQAGQSPRYPLEFENEGSQMKDNDA